LPAAGCIFLESAVVGRQYGFQYQLEIGVRWTMGAFHLHKSQTYAKYI